MMTVVQILNETLHIMISRPYYKSADDMCVIGVVNVCTCVRAPISKFYTSIPGREILVLYDTGTSTSCTSY